MIVGRIDEFGRALLTLSLRATPDNTDIQNVGSLG